jgi:hypothetical protein
MASYLAMMTTSNYPGLSTFIDVVVGISVVIGFIVIFQAMYTAVMERTREIGILKSMGASKLYIVNVVLRETVLAGSCRHRPGHPGESGGPGGTGSQVSAGAGGGRWYLDRARHGYCIVGAIRRCAVSGVQGGPEGSDRRVGLRIGTETGWPSTISLFISPWRAGFF